MGWFALSAGRAPARCDTGWIVPELALIWLWAPRSRGRGNTRGESGQAA